MERPFDAHLDNAELNALVPSPSAAGQEADELSAAAVGEARRHAESCLECARKVSQYRHFLSRLSSIAVTEPVPPGSDCPKDDEVDWHEVAAGLWPELKAKQLITHAALCGHCGPLLRAASSAGSVEAGPKQSVPASRKAPSPWLIVKWLVPVTAIIVAGLAFGIKMWSPSGPLRGRRFAEFAVRNHKQHAQGGLALDVHADSQQALNAWFKAKLPFSMALPASPAAPGEKRPYHLEGARLVQIDRQTAAFIAYQVHTETLQPVAASLTVTPDSVAVASDGAEVKFKKVTFHYATVEGYNVVTWSVHGLTYGLVSREGTRTQRSCMICHSPMRDRDLSHTPVWAHGNAGSLVRQ